LTGPTLLEMSGKRFIGHVDYFQVAGY